MIDLYYWPTPNGWKITIFLEEASLPYRVVPVDITRGQQFEPTFLQISPNNRMPAVVDHAPADGGDPVSVFESGAILWYLAEKTGKFLPSEARARARVSQWLHWQMGGLGPMSGQANHFRNYAPERIAYATDRYINEVRRLYSVMNTRLATAEHLADDYSIADMASWPWVRGHRYVGLELAEWPHLERWFKAVGARDAVARGVAVGTDLQRPLDDEARKHLFGVKKSEA